MSQTEGTSTSFARSFEWGRDGVGTAQIFLGEAFQKAAAGSDVGQTAMLCGGLPNGAAEGYHLTSGEPHAAGRPAMCSSPAGTSRGSKGLVAHLAGGGASEPSGAGACLEWPWRPSTERSRDPSVDGAVGESQLRGRGASRRRRHFTGFAFGREDNFEAEREDAGTWSVSPPPYLTDEVDIEANRRNAPKRSSRIESFTPSELWMRWPVEEESFSGIRERSPPPDVPANVVRASRFGNWFDLPIPKVNEVEKPLRLHREVVASSFEGAAGDYRPSSPPR
eukprot:CAMPEP_0115757908 /NCGR_PEP_ID=MMETSP0272-20121206/98664_1 /TAXON_ID=71861 /ORGANISM="Scrippsiella trochoidea, Strain CCMP3099" /LENGTH=278 /DNA_ID=CAMNT_0003203433 /DNA_START=98 /DNA_END=930 /DNA_ORIENTATION=-